MPSRICCSEKHVAKGVSTWEVAIALSEGRPAGQCKKCGRELHYFIEHEFAGDPNEKEYEYMLTRAVRLRRGPAGNEDYDPFLFVLRDMETGKEHILPSVWAFGQSNMARAGQLPPLLSLEEWKTLFTQLDSGFRQLEERIRLRAYELYEQRGKLDGHAIEDWLQAEADLAKPRVLRAAA